MQGDDFAALDHRAIGRAGHDACFARQDDKVGGDLPLHPQRSGAFWDEFHGERPHLAAFVQVDVDGAAVLLGQSS